MMGVGDHIATWTEGALAYTRLIKKPGVLTCDVDKNCKTAGASRGDDLG